METVINVNDQKSLFSSFLEALESREKKVQAEKELQEEKYLRRTQRIYDFHERQCREVSELRQCLQYVTEHALVLETVVRGAVGETVPLSVALVRQAAALHASMQQCVGNATRIRDLIAAKHHPHMDTLLAKMENELRNLKAFLSGASTALLNTDALIDNIHNVIEAQRRCVSEVSASVVFASICEGGASPERRVTAAACSTPIARD